MPIIHTALPVEGKLFRKAYGLVEVEKFRGISISIKDNILLVISGVGKIPTSVALTYAVNRYPKTADYFLNFGIAGSLKKDRELGTALLISRITDHATNRDYYTDLFLKPRWNLARLTTVDTPVTSGDWKTDTDLVDMEASAFFRTALYFVESHRIQSVKIVSDYMEGIYCRSEDVENWAESQRSALLEWIEAHRLDPSPRELEGLDYREVLESISENLHLSHSQSLELKKALDSFTKRHQKLPRGFEKFLYKKEESPEKEKGKQRLEWILRFLYDG